MLLLIAVIVLAFVAQWYVLKYGLEGVTLVLEPSDNLAEPAEPFEVRTTLENKKRFLPVLLQVREILPEPITLVGEGHRHLVAAHQVSYKVYSQYLKGRSRVVRTYQATLPRRGRYFFYGASLRGNDFFGIEESTLNIENVVEIVVIPPRAPLATIAQSMGGFLGEVSVRRYIMEDPILTTGFREYTGREPLRAISWNQTARGRGMMVKQYDYTTDPSVTVLLSVAGGTPEEMEACFSITRTVCEYLESKRIRYDFLTNASSAGALGIWKSVGEGLGAQHLNRILEGLGRATYSCTESLEATLNRARRRIGSPSYLVILPRADVGMQGQVQAFSAQTGGSLQMLIPQEVSL